MSGGSMRSKGVRMAVRDFVLALGFPLGVTIAIAVAFLLRVG